MTPVPKPRRWIWFFAVLVLMAIAGVTIPIVYNLRQQMKREDLDRAMQLWAENGPPSYNLRYVVMKPNSKDEEYHVEVRDSKVRSAHLDGKPLSPHLWAYHDMPGRFRDIKGFLDEDMKPGKPRVFALLDFDASDGRLKRYVRSVKGTRERVEIRVKEYLPITTPSQP